MIKMVILDLDGVLVDTRDMHYEALNGALNKFDEKYVIGYDEHLTTYDGLPTTKKLNKLSETKGLPKSLHNDVWKLKQEETIRIIKENWVRDERIISLLYILKRDGYIVCCATNSIRESAKLMLLYRGFMEHIDYFVTNQDVKHPKPSVEMYLKCMVKFNVSPSETLIVEDSHFGREAAIKSGSHVCPVKNYDDFTHQKLYHKLNEINGKELYIKPKWLGGNMNVLIPMAGAGSRFEKAGYTFPKPLIEVNGKPMIQLIVENLNIEGRHIFIVQKEHYEKYNLNYLLKLIAPNCEIVQVDGITEGAACTTLLAKKFIDNNEPLVIANSDQYVDWDSNTFMYAMQADNIDAGILSFKSTHPKWSFAKLDENGYVCEVAEKKPISDIATVGIYYWNRGSDYVKYAEQMIDKDIRVNNEFYVCPVFNEAIGDGLKIKTYNVEKMWGIGTPEDLSVFLGDHK